MIDAQVRKSYEEKRRRRKARGQKRPWRLKRMAMELEDDSAPGAGISRGREQRGGAGGSRHDQDMERFMQVGVPQFDPSPFGDFAGISGGSPAQKLGSAHGLHI